MTKRKFLWHPARVWVFGKIKWRWLIWVWDDDARIALHYNNTRYWRIET